MDPGNVQRGNAQRTTLIFPDRFKTQEMCIKAIEVDPYTLKFVPAHLRTNEMCKRVVEKYLHPMRDVPRYL